MRSPALPQLRDEMVACRACPRLVAWREEVGRVKAKRFRESHYWAKPVPGFGDPLARVLIVGLAPGAHGANRTGRMFTGDRSGEFLFAAMHRARLANQPASLSRDDGLVLSDAYVLAAGRCVPPENAPNADELARCARFLDAEIALLPRVRVFVALGAIAWRACLAHASRAGVILPRPRAAFAHGAAIRLERPRPHLVLGSFHVSQQNTQTGKLTPAMLDAVLAQATAEAERALPTARTREC